jgi:hypothetical protein
MNSDRFFFRAGTFLRGGKMKLGNCEIEVIRVDFLNKNSEEGGMWLLGCAHVVWRAGDGHSVHYIDLRVGCWTDTDDDYAEWCAANEGAQAIECCIFGKSATDRPGDTRGGFVRRAFADACDELGGEICAMLRESADVSPIWA